MEHNSHHRAAIDATTALLGDSERARLRRLDRARRFRNDRHRAIA